MVDDDDKGVPRLGDPPVIGVAVALLFRLAGASWLIAGVVAVVCEAAAAAAAAVEIDTSFPALCFPAAAADVCDDVVPPPVSDQATARGLPGAFFRYGEVAHGPRGNRRMFRS